MFTRHIFICGAALVSVSCSLAGQNPPPLAGPSDLGFSVTLTATPDVITQDGVSQAQVAALARDAMGQPAKGVSFRVDMQVDGRPVEFGTLGARFVATSSNGHAAVTYTAPPAPPVTVETDTTVRIVFTPIGTDFSNTVPRTVDLRLVRPGVIVPPRH